MDTRTTTEIKLDALQRLIMNNTLSGTLPLYIVTEYPKSGGSWLSSMMAEYLEVPFPRNRRPDITSSIMHGHMLYSPLMSNITCLYRDGRDVVVSLYFHMLFQNDKNSPVVVKRTRSELAFNDFEDIRNNLSQFIEYIYTRENSSISPFKFTWDRFVRSWMDKNVNKVKYESLIDDCYGTMKTLLENITKNHVNEDRLKEVIQKYSFENQTKRKPGEEDLKSFIRKGKPGDWKEKFTKQSACTFNKYYLNQMIDLDYVKDESWVESIGE